MRRVPPEVQLRILDLEFERQGARDVARSRNGLFVKRPQGEGKARQELHATQLARFLLPEGLGLPQPWGVIGDEHYVAEALTEKLCRNDPDHLALAVDYLAALHAVEIGPEVQRALIEAGYEHYRGGALRHRLAQELEHAQHVFAGEGRLAGAVEQLGELVSAALERWDFEDDLVLGHGDFHTSNLFLRDGRLVPVDWTDFGVCDRSYEVMHFANSIPSKHHEEALARYARRTGIEPVSLSLRGGVVDAIVRGGGQARVAGEGRRDFERCAHEFSEQVANGHRALTHLRRAATRP